MKIASRIQSSEPLNGIRFFSITTGAADVVTVYGSFLGGHSFAPSENPMVPRMVVSMLDEGTHKHTKHEISTALESVGASLRFACYNHYIGFTIHCLKSRLPLALDLLAEQLREPAFNPEDLATEKKRIIANLLQIKEDTERLSLIGLSQALYPKEHPNYDEDVDVAIQNVEKVTTEDLKRYHETTYGLGTMTLVAGGDIDHAETNRILGIVFRDWQQAPITQAQHIYKAHTLKIGEERYITVKDKLSVDVNMGTPLYITRSHPDFYPLFIGNYILGGDTMSRLNQAVRERRGLTYHIHSGIGGTREEDDGYWYISASFAPKVLVRGLDIARREIERFAIRGITAQELTGKKNTIANRYLVGLATTDGIAARILNVLEQGKPLDYLDQFPDIIRSVTLKQVNDAIKQYLDPKKIVTIAAGSVDAKGNPLEK